jgi:hypothetical protein
LALGHREGKVIGMLNATLDEQLWQTALEAAGAFKIDPSCQLFLHAWIANGAELMLAENRVDSADIVLAKESLATVVTLMKNEAIEHGTGRLDNRCFRAVEQSLERRSFLTVYSLWPFWPPTIP